MIKYCSIYVSSVRIKTDGFEKVGRNIVDTVSLQFKRFD